MPRHALLALGLVLVSLAAPSAQTEIVTGDYSTPLRALTAAGNVGISMDAGTRHGFRNTGSAPVDIMEIFVQ